MLPTTSLNLRLYSALARMRVIPSLGCLPQYTELLLAFHLASGGCPYRVFNTRSLDWLVYIKSSDAQKDSNPGAWPE